MKHDKLILLTCEVQSWSWERFIISPLLTWLLDPSVVLLCVTFESILWACFCYHLTVKSWEKIRRDGIKLGMITWSAPPGRPTFCSILRVSDFNKVICAFNCSCILITMYTCWQLSCTTVGPVTLNGQFMKKDLKSAFILFFTALLTFLFTTYNNSVSLFEVIKHLVMLKSFYWQWATFCFSPIKV